MYETVSGWLAGWRPVIATVPVTQVSHLSSLSVSLSPLSLSLSLLTSGCHPVSHRSVVTHLNLSLFVSLSPSLCPSLYISISIILSLCLGDHQSSISIVSFLFTEKIFKTAYRQTFLKNDNYFMIRRKLHHSIYIQQIYCLLPASYSAAVLLSLRSVWSSFISLSLSLSVSPRLSVSLSHLSLSLSLSPLCLSHSLTPLSLCLSSFFPPVNSHFLLMNSMLIWFMIFRFIQVLTKWFFLSRYLGTTMPQSWIVDWSIIRNQKKGSKNIKLNTSQFSRHVQPKAVVDWDVYLNVTQNYLMDTYSLEIGIFHTLQIDA